MLVFYLVFRGGTLNWLPGITVMVSSWQMLRGGGTPTVVVVLISRPQANIHYMKVIQCTHTLNVPSCNEYWPEDGLMKPKHVAKTMYY